MKFEDYIKKDQVRKAKSDKFLAKSLLDTAEMDLRFLVRIRIDSISARKIMSNYYDVLRSILEAIVTLDGYKIYSHEAFTYFLLEKGDLVISKKFDRFRKIRNKINYYGKNISKEETEENVEEIKRLIKILKHKYLDKL